jgi:hypothetical protein
MKPVTEFYQSAAEGYNNISILPLMLNLAQLHSNDGMYMIHGSVWCVSVWGHKPMHQQSLRDVPVYIYVGLPKCFELLFHN